jgi:hypothetical protein
MVGWWLAALLAVGRAQWWLRLPEILLPFLLAWGRVVVAQNGS